MLAHSKPREFQTDEEAKAEELLKGAVPAAGWQEETKPEVTGECPADLWGAED